MFNFIKAILFLVIINITLDSSGKNIQPNDSSFKVLTIDMLDTVVFNLSRADTSNSYFDVPVFIRSNDTVNALDFSFKYNEMDFTYDSIIDLTNYLQTFSYYNPFDSTLRFTSNSFQRYQNDSDLVAIRFNRIFGQFCVDDLRAVKVYLNGDMCSIKIIDCLHLGFETIQNKTVQPLIYPNPAQQYFTLKILENAQLEILSSDGRCVKNCAVFAHQENQVAIDLIPNGFYIIKIFNSHFTEIKKLIIQN